MKACLVVVVVTGVVVASSGSSIRMSRNTNNSSSLRRCQLEEMLGNDKSVAQLRTGEGAAAGKEGKAESLQIKSNK